MTWTFAKPAAVSSSLSRFIGMPSFGSQRAINRLGAKSITASVPFGRSARNRLRLIDAGAVRW
jgi:hypothetical protein